MNPTKTNEDQTTAQMLGAGKYAVYVWPTRKTLEHAKELSRKLGRGDLQVVTSDEVCADRVIGTNVPVVLDHAVDETCIRPDAAKAIQYHNSVVEFPYVGHPLHPPTLEQ